MNPGEKTFRKLLLLAAGAWVWRAVGPELHGTTALSTQLLAAVVIQAGLWLSPARLAGWTLGVGLAWDVLTFSALGHHVLVLGLTALLVRSQRGWWLGASAGEQAAGSVLAAVSYFALDRLFHLVETRSWDWPFALSVSLVIAGLVNGLVSVALGWWLERKAELPARRVSRRLR